jgi:hypothetical protein
MGEGFDFPDEQLVRNKTVGYFNPTARQIHALYVGNFRAGFISLTYIQP